jgi:hypothetical protein
MNGSEKPKHKSQDREEKVIALGPDYVYCMQDVMSIRIKRFVRPALPAFSFCASLLIH